MKSTTIALVLAGVTAMTPNTWRVVEADVRVICPMTIGGSFEAKTTALSGSVTAGANGSRALGGTLAVSLRTLDTGLSLRNEHLRANYLEVDKAPGFDVATLSEIELQGLNPDAPQGRGSFAASLTLHGVTRPVTGTVDIRPAGTGLHVRATFPVRLPEYAIRKPRYLGIGVEDTVRVEVAFIVLR